MAVARGEAFMREREITVRLEGPSVARGRLGVNDFVHLIKGIQVSVKRIGLNRAGRRGGGPGRLPRDIETACSLEVVSLDRGSLAVTLALPEPVSQVSLFDDVGEEALALLIEGLGVIDRSTDSWPEAIDHSVIEPLLDMSRLLDRGIERLEFRSGEREASRKALIDHRVRTRLRSQLERPMPFETTAVGLLMEVDFKDHTAELHEPSGNVVKLSFIPEEDELMREAAKARVRAFGEGERNPNGRLVRLKLRRLEIIGEMVLEGEGSALRLPDEAQLTPWRREEDPFRDAKPLAELTVLIGGLPDNRDPEEILKDLRQSRAIRPLDHRE